jgi:hypothetical protein
MNALITTRTLAASAFVAAATLSMLSFGNSAQAASNLAGCTGPFAKQVIDCCQKVTADHRPLWMRDTGATCTAAAACKAGGGGIHLAARTAMVLPPKYCFIKIVLLDDSSNLPARPARKR